jgi:hypothetical protein
MPSRKINTRGKKLSLNLDKSPTEAAPETFGEIIDTAVNAAIEAAPTEATDIIASAAHLDNTVPDAVAADIIQAVYGPHEALPEAAPTEAAPVAPVAAAPAVPDAKAAFLDRKANATLSAISLYPGASLAVHRSDKQPADATYLARVASPVQKIGPNGPTVRDNSFILAVYDYLTTYFGGNYAVGFNPANFGADLGTTSRAASVGYLALTDDASDIVLTPTGIERGALLTRKRAEAAAKAAK